MTSVSRMQLPRRLMWTVFWSILAFIYLFPYTWMVLTGFRAPIDTITMPPRFFFTPTLDGFSEIFRIVGFGRYLSNSLIISVSATALIAAVGAPAAYALAHLSTNSRVFLLSVLIARMIPGVAIVIPIYLVAAKLGQLDTHHILVVIYAAFNLPLAIWLMRSFFREIPPEVREAAIIDGCSELQTFRHIMLPLAAGGIAATSVFVFIFSWNEFLFSLILTNSRAPTAPLAVLGFRNEYGVQWGAIGAAAMMISTPVVVFALAMQKYLVRGFTMGSLK